MRQKNSPQSGNILIYILGAIFLLGILIVIVRGSSTPGSNIEYETVSLRANELQQYGQELERAVAYVVSSGHSEADIRFAHPDAQSSYGLITDVPARQVFSSQGGSATYRLPAEGIQTAAADWMFSGINSILQVGSSSADLIAILPYITQDLCVAINKKNDIAAASDYITQDDGTANITTLFTGNFADTSIIADDNGGPEYLAGRLEGCFEGGGTPASGTYHYYRVLLAR